MSPIAESIYQILTGPFFWSFSILLVIINIFIYLKNKNSIIFRIVISISILLEYGVVVSSFLTYIKLYHDNQDRLLVGASSIILGLIIFLIVTYILITTVIHPINLILEENEKLSQADLSRSIPEWKFKDDEIYSLGLSFNTITTNFENLLAKISSSTMTINTSTTSMSSSIQELNSSFEEVTNVINQIATETVNQNKLVNKSLGRVKALENEFRIQSSKISNATNLIQSISSQVNMLSLNASIEAARAGEYGRGFAVVADNIRQLADQTKISLVEIEDSVTELNTKLEAQIKAITTDVEEIISSSELTSAGSEEASASTEEQSATLQEIFASSQELSNLVESLENLVKQFKLKK